jgi:hypothetical protein
VRVSVRDMGGDEGEETERGEDGFLLPIPSLSSTPSIPSIPFLPSLTAYSSSFSLSFPCSYSRPLDNYHHYHNSSSLPSLLQDFGGDGPLRGVEWQRVMERRAAVMGGGTRQALTLLYPTLPCSTLPSSLTLLSSIEYRSPSLAPYLPLRFPFLSSHLNIPPTLTSIILQLICNSFSLSLSLSLLLSFSLSLPPLSFSLTLFYFILSFSPLPSTIFLPPSEHYLSLPFLTLSFSPLPSTIFLSLT